MNLPTYTPADYVAYLKMSKRVHLLVEGPSDQRFVKRLIEKSQLDAAVVVVENGWIISGLPSGLPSRYYGNNGRIEYVAELVQRSSVAGKFVCFSDREFRRFSFRKLITDNLKRHHVSGKTIWTRGHSLENYFFVDELFGEVVLNSCTSMVASNVADEVKRASPDLLRLASAISVVADQSLELGLISNVDQLSSIFAINGILNFDGKLAVDFQEMVKQLASRGVDIQTASSIAKGIELRIVELEGSEPELSRWVCNGHIGIAMFGWLITSIVRFVCVNSGQTTAEAAKAASLISAVPRDVWLTQLSERYLARGSSRKFGMPSPLLRFLRAAVAAV